MPRNSNALAIVNAAFLLKLNPKNKVIEEAAILFGNISPTFTHAYKTEQFLIGKTMNNNVLQGAVNILQNEIKPIDDPSLESPECRKKLAIGLFYKVRAYEQDYFYCFILFFYFNFIFCILVYIKH